jgi:hypothetical protein
MKSNTLKNEIISTLIAFLAFALIFWIGAEFGAKMDELGY